MITWRVTWRVRDRWTYGDVWCQVSGVTHGMSITVSIWSISMIGLHRFDLYLIDVLSGYRDEDYVSHI